MMVIENRFPISDLLLERAVEKLVMQFWDYATEKGLSLAQITFYVEREFDRVVPIQRTVSALEHLVSQGRLQKQTAMKRVARMSLGESVTDLSEVRKECRALPRFFPSEVS